MNISTGGPRILLFERDKQLATLLTSELQLAGYDCHTARTAVEVFDAIARYPIKLVLVNLAQAAASRREFWVALDTQKRGRGIQVFSFLCANIASYGPKDLEDTPQNVMPDIEIDGMSGLMHLVEVVRGRLSNTTQMAAMPRTPGTLAQVAQLMGQQTFPSMPPAQPLAPQPAPNMPPAQPLAQQPAPSMPASQPLAQQLAPSMPPAQPLTQQSTPAMPSAGGSTFRSPFISAPQYQMPVRNAAMAAPFPSMPDTPSIASIPGQVVAPPATPIVTTIPTMGEQTGANASQSTYSEKIRAVLYPNQRNWSSAPANATPSAEEKTLHGGPPPFSAAQFSTVQNSSNRQSGGAGESGLAQLSRLVQSQQSAENRAINSTPAQQSGTLQWTTPPPATEMPTQAATNTSPANYSSASTIQSSQGGDYVSTQHMRAAPIQELPVERAGSTMSSSESTRRSDMNSRLSYGQQAAARPSLSSIATPQQAQLQSSLSRRTHPLQAETQEEDHASERGEITGRLSHDGKEKTGSNAFVGTSQAAMQGETNKSADQAPSNTPNNAMIIDIMQSLPPMPPVSEQAQELQSAILNGRATRSLGSVLVSGHLVPEDRLEVAQHIQRMLRGVDLNYQLGEILLMFKLLTPDQLLAASLVSYGMITTTQISALGRIRQELHAIGLEYDLENLVILFRLLTPEQLREVKSSWQG